MNFCRILMKLSQDINQILMQDIFPVNSRRVTTQFFIVQL